MRFRYWILTVVLFICLYLSLHIIPSSFADSPTPTPRPRTIFAPSNGQYFSYLPLIQISLNVLKKGVPLTYPYDGDCATVATMNASWEYSWLPNPPNCPGVENIPMIETAGDVNRTLTGNSLWIMGFNEPDARGLSASDAAGYWRQIETMYPTRKLLAPAPTGAHPSWIVDFRNAYISSYGVPPRLDGLAAHCFSWAASECISIAQQFKTWAIFWGMSEVWVTEFSFSPVWAGPSGALQEQQTFIDWMVGEPMITRYAWFASRMTGNEWWSLSAFQTPLVDFTTGQPTSFGNVYLPYR